MKRLAGLGKIITEFNKAIQDIKDGATIIVGGFGLSGIPENLILAGVGRKGNKGLNDC